MACNCKAEVVETQAHLAPAGSLLEAITDLVRCLSHRQVLAHVPALRKRDVYSVLGTKEHSFHVFEVQQLHSRKRARGGKTQETAVFFWQPHLPLALHQLHAEGEVLCQRVLGRPAALLERLAADEEVGTCST